MFFPHLEGSPSTCLKGKNNYFSMSISNILYLYKLLNYNVLKLAFVRTLFIVTVLHALYKLFNFHSNLMWWMLSSSLFKDGETEAQRC